MTSLVVRFQKNDFELDSSYPIAIKNKNCGMILFHVNNEDSFALGTILLDFVSDKIVPVDRLKKFIGTCNFEVETEVSQAFLEIARTNRNIEKFAINRLPCFIVYQNGFPVSFWEGGEYVNNPFTTETIGNFFTFEVCNRDLQYKNQTSRKGLNYYRETRDPETFVFGDSYTIEEQNLLEYETGMKKSKAKPRTCNGDECYIIKPTIIQMISREPANVFIFKNE